MCIICSVYTHMMYIGIVYTLFSNQHTFFKL